jgi:hypothetical protein
VSSHLIPLSLFKERGRGEVVFQRTVETVPGELQYKDTTTTFFIFENQVYFSTTQKHP